MNNVEKYGVYIMHGSLIGWLNDSLCARYGGIIPNPTKGSIFETFSRCDG